MSIDLPITNKSNIFIDMTQWTKPEPIQNLSEKAIEVMKKAEKFFDRPYHTSVSAWYPTNYPYIGYSSGNHLDPTISGFMNILPDDPNNIIITAEQFLDYMDKNCSHWNNLSLMGTFTQYKEEFNEQYL